MSSLRRADGALRATAAAAALFATASCGTLVSRFDRGAAVVGWYPGMAVEVDIRGICLPADPVWGHSGAAGDVAILSALSLPLDLVLDTALLPFDLLAALCGCRKSLAPAPRDADHDMTDDASTRRKW